MTYDMVIPHEIIFLDCQYPWGPSVAAFCESLHLQVRRMQMRSGFELVNWPEVAAVIFGTAGTDTDRIVESIRFLARWHPQVMTLVDTSGAPSLEWAVREAGAVWTFESIYDLEHVACILRRIVAAHEHSQHKRSANAAGSWQRLAEGCVSQALGPIIGYDNLPNR